MLEHGRVCLLWGRWALKLDYDRLHFGLGKKLVEGKAVNDFFVISLLVEVDGPENVTHIV